MFNRYFLAFAVVFFGGLFTLSLPENASAASAYDDWVLTTPTLTAGDTGFYSDIAANIDSILSEKASSECYADWQSKSLYTMLQLQWPDNITTVRQVHILIYNPGSQLTFNDSPGQWFGTLNGSDIKRTIFIAVNGPDSYYVDCQLNIPTLGGPGNINSRIYSNNVPVVYPEGYSGLIPPDAPTVPQEPVGPIYEDCDPLDVACHFRNGLVWAGWFFTPDTQVFSRSFSDLSTFFGDKFGLLLYPFAALTDIMAAIVGVPSGAPSCNSILGHTSGIPGGCTLEFGPVLGAYGTLEFGLLESMLPTFFTFFQMALIAGTTITLLFGLKSKYMGIIKS